MDININNYKNKLQKLRNGKNLSQDEIANILGIARQTYNHYEIQENIIPLIYLNDLANFYNVSIDYILDFTEFTSYNNSKKAIDYIEFGKRLKNLRKSKKITLKKMAEKILIDYRLISKYENGTNKATTIFIMSLCKKYNISADYLLGKIDYIPDWCDNYLKNE